MLLTLFAFVTPALVAVPQQPAAVVDPWANVAAELHRRCEQAGVVEIGRAHV